ncbi:MAG TPA: uroporphyrinogen-III C-methyltransferase [Usitatibacter sp.]|nr:uroporphyrinogen-III C-methyltransferase [Usitatibacter sp.]
MSARGSIVGKVYLVGAGPGAPDLLTLRAARLLEAADIVFHDALVHPDILALAGRARQIDVGKRYGKVSTEQRFINRALIEAARTHSLVVRLKGGDPMLFGRAQEELDALKAAGIECEVVPGVTAALAAAATLKVSLTRRGIARTVVFLTPRVGKGESASEWLAPALAADSVVLYMAAGAATSIAASLIGAGKPGATPVALVESATLPEERRLFTTLEALQSAKLPPATGPVVVCVGEVFRESSFKEIDHANLMREVSSARL